MKKNYKLLYISRNNANARLVGGSVGRKNHEDALSEIFQNNFFKCLLDNNKNNMSMIFYRLFFAFFPEITLSTFSVVDKKIKEIDPHIIFIESSNYGKLVKYIKKRYSIPIVTFFHNIEIELAKSSVSLFKIKTWIYYFVSKVNEELTVRHSDKYIMLNERDSNLLKRIYNKEADCLLPVAFKDALDCNTLEFLKKNHHVINSRECLFVGTNFIHNVSGVHWFIENVLPFVDIKLLIIGEGMTKAFSETDRITVIDYVEDLSKYYINCDFIIGPIFSGGGMKTKAAEAMMWGKAIIGTDEMFCGYAIENIKGLYRCNNRDEMVKTIHTIYNDTIYNYNDEIRNLYLSKYSYHKSIEILSNFFEAL